MCDVACFGWHIAAPLGREGLMPAVVVDVVRFPVGPRHSGGNLSGFRLSDRHDRRYAAPPQREPHPPAAGRRYPPTDVPASTVENPAVGEGNRVKILHGRLPIDDDFARDTQFAQAPALAEHKVLAVPIEVGQGRAISFDHNGSDCGLSRYVMAAFTCRCTVESSDRVPASEAPMQAIVITVAMTARAIMVSRPRNVFRRVSLAIGDYGARTSDRRPAYPFAYLTRRSFCTEATPFTWRATVPARSTIWAESTKPLNCTTPL